MAGTADGEIAEFEKQAQACRAKGDQRGLAVALGWWALLLRRRGELGAAMEHLAEQEEICQQLGEPRELAACLGNQALIYMDWDDLAAADSLLERASRPLCVAVSAGMLIESPHILDRTRPFLRSHHRGDC
jgi:hypothetical protein